jgi:hypothetical protein
VTQTLNNKKNSIAFIDLAGNEPDWNTGVGAALNDETLFINKSLSDFSLFISNVSEKRYNQPSQLTTKIIGQYLIGNVKLNAIFCIPAGVNYQNRSLFTINSLSW